MGVCKQGVQAHAWVETFDADTRQPRLQSVVWVLEEPLRGGVGMQGSSSFETGRWIKKQARGVCVGTVD